MSGLIFFLKNSIRMAKDFYVLVKDKSYSASSKTLTVYWEEKVEVGGERFLKGREIKIWKNDHVKQPMICLRKL